MNKLLVPIEEASEMLSVPTAVTQQLIADGEIASLVISGVCLIPHDEIVEYVVRIRRRASEERQRRHEAARHGGLMQCCEELESGGIRCFGSHG